MPKLTHRVPKYRRHKTGQAVVTINGLDQYLGKWGSKASKTEYDRLIAEYLVSNRQPPPARCETDLTVTELVARYWQFAKGYYVKNGRSTGVTPGIKVAMRFLRRYYGNTAAADVGPLALRALQDRMVEAGCCRPYVNENIARMKRMFKWAVSNELVPETVYRALATVPGLKKGRTKAREPEPVCPVSDEVVDATLPYLPPVVADMVRFHRQVGCRPSEVCVIRPSDIDRSGDPWCYVPASHKAEHHGRKRRIYIGPKAQQVLLPYLLRDAEACCFSPAESREKQYEAMRAKRKTKVQPSQRNRRQRQPLQAPGHHYTKDSYGRAIRRAVDRANKARKEEDKIPYWHPNQLRHVVGTKVRQEFGIEAAQVVLGHANADVTQVYAERDFGLAAQIMKKIG